MHMAEPSTTTVAAATTIGGVSLATVLLHLDGNAFVGAFAGATLMALSAKDINWPTRCMYLIISWLMGYMAAPDVMAHLPIESSGVAAFLTAALVVTVTLQLIERARTFDFGTLLRRKGGP